MLTIGDKFYTAGLIDGEGTVTLTKRGQYRFPTVSMASTTYELIQYLLDTFGGTVCKRRTKASIHHADSWIWTIRNDAAINFLDDIADLLKEPKKYSRARLIIDEYKSVTKRNGKYTDKEKERKLGFEAQFFAL